MCGIAGYVGRSLVDPEQRKQVLTDMMDMIVHRGPNSAGQFIDDRAAMGFRRLSIIDLEGGNQPIYNENEDKVITFNGEIYNFPALKKTLIAAGHRFSTKADTEVILHGYEEWGTDVVKKLRGMFAFVIYDRKTGELFGARDHFGIKPFYYSLLDNGDFLYGSEIKSFLPYPAFERKLNKKALKPFLFFQYSAMDTETFFEGVYKLPEGHCFTLKDGKMQIRKFWDMNFREGRESLDEIVDEIDDAVVESVNAHRIADVEVGSFLSSGVDSSFVAAVLRPDKTYSVGFDKTYNEAMYAEKLADHLHINHSSRVVSADEAFEAFPKIQWYLDEPDANPSCVPLYFLSELASRELRVVMSGEGADELFAGYQDYGPYTKVEAVIVLANVLKHLPKPFRKGLLRLLKKSKRNFRGKLEIVRSLDEPRNFFVGQAKIMEESEAEALLTAPYRKSKSVREILDPIFDRSRGLSNVKQMQYNDIHHFMTKDILLKADKMSMAHSLELRVPLLDRKLAEVAEKVPTPYLIKGKTSKFAFRQAASRHLPKEWFNRKKMGFPTPIKAWLETETYYKQVRELFAMDFAGEFFDQAAILKLLDDTYAKKVNGRRKVWTIFTFLTWYKAYFIDWQPKRSA